MQTPRTRTTESTSHLKSGWSRQSFRRTLSFPPFIFSTISSRSSITAAERTTPETSIQAASWLPVVISFSSTPCGAGRPTAFTGRNCALAIEGSKSPAAVLPVISTRVPGAIATGGVRWSTKTKAALFASCTKSMSHS